MACSAASLIRGEWENGQRRDLAGFEDGSQGCGDLLEAGKAQSRSSPRASRRKAVLDDTWILPQ